MKARIPHLAERLMTWSLSDADREAILGDLSEEFAGRAIEYGARHARRWYWRQTLRSLAPNLRQRLAGAPFDRGSPVRIPDPPKPAITESIMTDLRDAVRALRAAPSFTFVALVVLALGIGARWVFCRPTRT